MLGALFCRDIYLMTILGLYFWVTSVRHVVVCVEEVVGYSSHYVQLINFSGILLHHTAVRAMHNLTKLTWEAVLFGWIG